MDSSTLRAALGDVVPGSTVGSLGITAFIKEELVADGNRAPAVRFPHPGRLARGRAASKRGLAIGRGLDRAFADSVDRGERVIPGSANSRVHAALRAVGIVPVKTQHRVVTQQSMLTTCLDGVGIADDGGVVCIELKTCQLPSGEYEAYANTACRRTPRLRCKPIIENTERNRHFIQTGYGAMALSAQLGRQCTGVLVVSTADKALVFMCPPSFMRTVIFQRLPTSCPSLRAPTAPRRASAARVGTLLVGLDWASTEVATRVGFVPQKPALSKGIYALKRANGDTVGALANAPTWDKLSKSNRMLIAHTLGRAAGKLKSRLPRVATYVVGPLTPGGGATLIVIGKPITVRSV